MHGGTIRIDSALAHGTTVALAWPTHGAAPHTEQPNDAPEPEPSHHPTEACTVLLVDDEEIIRLVGRRMLEKHGFRVLTAEDGSDGVRVFQAQHEEIDAVVLDLSMPRMDGHECLRRIREISSDVPVLLCSGYDDRVAGEPQYDTPRVSSVAKPTDMQRFVDAVSRAIRAALRPPSPPSPPSSPSPHTPPTT
jgi:CheY-like chemotaxis protein